MDSDNDLIINFNKFLSWLRNNKYFIFYEDGSFVSKLDDSYGFRVFGKIFDNKISLTIKKLSTSEHLDVIISDKGDFYNSRCEMFLTPEISIDEAVCAFRVNNMFFAGSISQESREKRLKRLLSDRTQKIYDCNIGSFWLDDKINFLLCSIDEIYADILLFVFPKDETSVDDIPRVGKKRVTRELKKELFKKKVGN